MKLLPIIDLNVLFHNLMVFHMTYMSGLFRVPVDMFLVVFKY